MIFRTRQPAPPPETIGGVPVRVNARAKRLSLRYDARAGDVVLVWPRRASLAAAEKFVAESAAWIARQRAAQAAQRVAPIAPGDTLDIMGRRITVEHTGGRGVSRIDGDRLMVTGDRAHFNRRLKDVLKREAENILTAKTQALAVQLGLKPGRVRILDPKSRWGSCGPDGTIMYSWRVILAPPFVVDYLVAHETAHRVHMNHGRAFWRLCLSLCDRGGEARRWLRLQGGKLMQVC